MHGCFWAFSTCQWGHLLGILLGVIFFGLGYRLISHLGCYFIDPGVIFLGLFCVLKKLPTTNRNWVITQRDMIPPRNNIPYENHRFSEKMLFLYRTFRNIPPRNMAGGVFGDAAFFLMLWPALHRVRCITSNVRYRYERKGIKLPLGT